jgi:hypothetical protein
MSNAPKFIKVRYLTTLVEDPNQEEKIQSKINMGSKTKGKTKRQKINFVARAKTMFSSPKK